MPEYQQEVPESGDWDYYGGGFSVGDALDYSSNNTSALANEFVDNLYYASLLQDSGLSSFDLTWIPRDGDYGGNGPNDAWLKWQNYVTFYGDGRTLVRGQADADYIMSLLAAYTAAHPDTPGQPQNDPLHMRPDSAQDQNALEHDLSSWGGAVHHIIGNVAYAVGNFVQGILTGSLYALASVPFIGVIASVYHTAQGVGQAVGAIGSGIASAGGDLFGGFSGALTNIMSGDFSGALNSIVTGISNAFSALGEAIGNAFKALFPVVIDMDGDGIHLVSAADSNVLLHGDDGETRYSGWVGSGEGILAFDQNHNGSVDGYAEFGLARFVQGAASDLEGLAAFDSNGDGNFDNQDDSFSDFLVWVDANANGVCDAGEVQTLAAVGISSIALALNGASSVNAGNYIANTTTVTFQNGEVRSASDVAFASSSAIDHSRMLGSHITSHQLGSGLEVVTLSAGGGDVVLREADIGSDTTVLVITSSTDGDTVTVTADVSATFLGSQGDDHFVGSDVRSTFRGGGGSNIFEGGVGADTFIIDAGADSRDNVIDHGGDDTFLISSDDQELHFFLHNGDLVVEGANGFNLTVRYWAESDHADQFIVDGVKIDVAALFTHDGHSAATEIVVPVIGSDWLLAA